MHLIAKPEVCRTSVYVCVWVNAFASRLASQKGLVFKGWFRQKHSVACSKRKRGNERKRSRSAADFDWIIYVSLRAGAYRRLANAIPYIQKGLCTQTLGIRCCLSYISYRHSGILKRILYRGYWERTTDIVWLAVRFLHWPKKYPPVLTTLLRN